MYAQHFGFSRPLFGDGVAQDDAVFRTEATSRLAADLALALERKDAVAILSGPSGTGKSTIAADALRAVGTRLAFSCISQQLLTAHELLEQLLTDFGFEPYRRSRVERLQQWRQFLSEMTATDSRVCLLIENAELLPPEVLVALHSLTAADAAQAPGCNVILTTTQPAESLLSARELLALNQRVCLRRRIEALSENEVHDYIEFRCRYAGADASQVFDKQTASLLFDYSAGVIRIIDNLLESALRGAAAANETSVTADRIVTVAEDQFGMTRMDASSVDRMLDLGTKKVSTDTPPDPADIPTLTETVLPGSSSPLVSITAGRAALR